MHLFTRAVSLTLLLMLFAAASTGAPTRTETLDRYGKLPLTFLPNRGQAHSDIVMLGEGAGFRFAFKRGEAFFVFTKETRGMALALDFVGGRAEAMPEGRGIAAGKVNHLLGNVPSRWQTGLPTYEEIVYRELWPGIDLVFRGAEGQLKYEFLVRPGADLRDIRLAYRGATGLSLDSSGRMEIGTPLGVLSDAAPISYQTSDGERVPVKTRYRLRGKRGYGFDVARHDTSRLLVIDPGLEYSTYLGGSSGENGYGIAVDAAGNAYVTGLTLSSDFPTTPGAFDTTFNAGVLGDVFVTKLNPSGTALVYSTYLGGSGTFEEGRAIAVDADGQAFVTGATSSSNFPTTPGAFDRTLNGGTDVFVTKLNAAGSALVYSTFIGGSASAPFGGTSNDQARAIAIDADGNAYLTGVTASVDYPTTAGAYDTTQNGSNDIFVTKLNAAGSALVYSTVIGTTVADAGQSIAIDSDGNAYVAGFTTSSAFPTTPGALDGSQNGSEDAIVLKFNATGSTLVYSTFLGGSDFDRANGIAVDAGGNAYITGPTSSLNFPITAGAFQGGLAGRSDVFVTKLDPSGSALVYSTYVGGGAFDEGAAIALDSLGNAHVTGRTLSTNYPTTPGAFDNSRNDAGDAEDVLVTKLNAAGSALLYSTYLGGSRSEAGQGIALSSGDAYVTGITSSSDFPVTATAYDTTGGGDVFVTKLDVGGAPSVPTTLTLDPATAANPVDTTHTVTATVRDAASQPFSGVTVRFSVSGSVSPSGSCVTDANGQCSFTYGGPAFPGADAISAYADSDGDATQDVGEPSATATKVWELPASTAGCKVTYGGRITAANGDKATFGQENYTDHGPSTPMKVKATSILATVCSSTSASIFGQATIDGSGTFVFRIDVKDLGEPGSADTYRIRLSNGYDSGEQPLEGGNVQIHKR